MRARAGRLDGELLGVTPALGGGQQVARQLRAGEVVIVAQGLLGGPGEAGDRDAEQLVGGLLCRGEVHDLAHRRVDGFGCRRVDQERQPDRAQLGVADREAEAVALDPELGRAGLEAAAAVVPPVRHDARVAGGVARIPSRVDRQWRDDDLTGLGIGQAVADLEGDELRVRGKGDQRRACGKRTR